MRVEAVNPDTGEAMTAEMPSLKTTNFDALTREYATDQQLKMYVERLPFSAEAKAILFKLAKLTVSVGERVVRIGKRILEIAIMLASKYRHATFALIIASLLTLLIGMIPLIGPILASILGPLMVALGLVVGVWEDLKRQEPKFAAVITDSGKLFEPLATVSA
jgi:hypothetical protein